MGSTTQGTLHFLFEEKNYYSFLVFPIKHLTKLLFFADSKSLKEKLLKNVKKEVR